MVWSGANPHSPIDNPLQVAALEGKVNALKIMMEEHQNALALSQQRRRKDIVLRKYPPAYFEDRERREEEEIQASTREALLVTLMRGNDACLKSAAFLMSQGAFLDDDAYARLLRTGGSTAPVGKCRFVARRHGAVPGERDDADAHWSDERNDAHWSGVLLDMEWMRDTRGQIRCPRMRRTPKKCVDFVPCDCSLVVADGRRLHTHKSILSSKSAKLDAALRFTALNGEKEVRLDVSFRAASFLLQHCYHGSILRGLSPSPSDRCRELLELSLLAEEFLCPSLVLECEMRLLSDDGTECFGRCCASCSRYAVQSPSRSITAEKAINVLAVSQRGFSMPSRSYVDLQPSNAPHVEGKGFFFWARAVALKTILQQFSEVLRSPACRAASEPCWTQELFDEGLDASMT